MFERVFHWWEGGKTTSTTSKKTEKSFNQRTFTDTKDTKDDDRVLFLALSDFGRVNVEVSRTAQAMAAFLSQPRHTSAHNFILGLGDNFYPAGVHRVDDEQFDSIWGKTFLKHASLRVPWRMVLGNHDYMGNPYAQVEYHYDPVRNRDGLWYMPSRFYDFAYHVVREDQKFAHGLEEKEGRLTSEGIASAEKPLLHLPAKLFIPGKDRISIDRQLMELRKQEDTLVYSQYSDRKVVKEAQQALQDSYFRVIENEDEEKYSEMQVKDHDENVDHQYEKLVEFFAIDTNACQDYLIANYYPFLVPELHRYLISLKERLKASKAKWKIVMGHHPMYTAGRGHAACGQKLRESLPVESCEGKEEELLGADVNPNESEDLEKQKQKKKMQKLRNKKTKFGLEAILLEAEVDLYLAGHEHVFQHHFHKGLHHVCCGASGAEIRDHEGDEGFYLGKHQEYEVDWVGNANDVGFVAVEVSREAIDVQFISNRNNHVFKHVQIVK